jgi:NADH:ubiquinone oxidoreductase subunit 4 (subunit M)
VVLVLLSKVPCYPLFFWLPEAHVEATWLGSVILASVILKFSLFGLLMYATTTSTTIVITVLLVLGSLSVTLATLALLSSADLKRIGAYLSIAHMNIGFTVLIGPSSDSIVSMDALWFGHSFAAMVYFVYIGLLYSRSGSRSVVSTGPDASSTVSMVFIAVLGLLNLGLPLGPLCWSELILFSTLSHSVSAGLTVVTFIALCTLPLFLVFNLVRSVQLSDTRTGLHDIPWSSTLYLSTLVTWYVVLCPC